MRGESTPLVVGRLLNTRLGRKLRSWCQPCTMLSPVLEKYTGDPSNTDGKEVDLVTVNVEEQQELAAKYKVGLNQHSRPSVSI
jgi:thiol-disulfide isomerase/thioredoxin